MVLLSSVGADLPEGTGPIRWLHHLESRLRETGATLTALRSPHFQEKVETVLGAATGAGIYPVFGDSADVPIADGRDPRHRRRGCPRRWSRRHAASEVVDLEAPSYTERQVAEMLGAVLGTDAGGGHRSPGPTGSPRLTGAGVPPLLAAELVELYDAENRGLLQPRGDRRHRCTTELADTLHRVGREPAGRPT